jgi:hypothetical protein
MKMRKGNGNTTTFVFLNGLRNDYSISEVKLSGGKLVSRCELLQEESPAREMERFELWCWRRMEKTKWSEKVTNEEVRLILRRYYLLHDAVEGQK